MSWHGLGDDIRGRGQHIAVHTRVEWEQWLHAWTVTQSEGQVAERRWRAA